MPVAKPRGGDAVRLATRWSIASAGDVGIIDGFCDADPEDDKVQITFHPSAYVGGFPEVASVSGGPGTIGTPVSQWSLTGEVFFYTAWMWRDGFPGGGKGVRYQRKARLWEWTPCPA